MILANAAAICGCGCDGDPWCELLRQAFAALIFMVLLYTLLLWLRGRS